MPDYNQIATCDSAANPAANATANTPTNTANDAAATATSAYAPATAGPASRSSRPLQLRRGGTRQLASRQEVVVLQDPPCRLPSSSRSTGDADANAGDAATSTRHASPTS